jgi:haloacetate dehalogenase
VIVGGQSHTSRFYSYEKAWATHASDLRGCIALPCGHYPAEQAPDETYAALREFFKT